MRTNTIIYQKASEWVDQVVQTTTGTYIMGSQPILEGSVSYEERNKMAVMSNLWK